MTGNVWEWTLSPYKEYPYNPEDGREAVEASGSRVLRGGSWDDGRYGARCAFRVGRYPSYWDYDGGFRVVSPS